MKEANLRRATVAQIMGFTLWTWRNTLQSPYWPWNVWSIMQTNGCDGWDQSLKHDCFVRWYSFQTKRFGVTLEVGDTPEEDHIDYRFGHGSLVNRRSEVAQSIEATLDRWLGFDMTSGMGTHDGSYGHDPMDYYLGPDAAVIAHLTFLNETAVANARVFAEKVMHE